MPAFFGWVLRFVSPGFLGSGCGVLLNCPGFCSYSFCEDWDISKGYSQEFKDCTARMLVDRLAGITDVRRGRTAITTRPAQVPDSRPDLVSRQFTASRPNELWVGDIKYVQPLSGFVCTAFVTDVYSRKIVGWARRSSMKTGAIPLEGLKQARQEPFRVHDYLL